MKIGVVRTLCCTYWALAHIVCVVGTRGIFLLLIDERVRVGVELMGGCWEKRLPHKDFRIALNLYFRALI